MKISVGLLRILPPVSFFLATASIRLTPSENVYKLTLKLPLMCVMQHRLKLVYHFVLVCRPFLTDLREFISAKSFFLHLHRSRPNLRINFGLVRPLQQTLLKIRRFLEVSCYCRFRARLITSCAGAGRLVQYKGVL